MRHGSALAPLAIVLLAAAWGGCGGSTEPVDFSTGDDGAGGASGTGQDAGLDPDGGSIPDPDDLDGGSDAEPDANPDPPQVCPPPMDPTKAALCLVLEPEPISFVANDPKLDGEGLLIVQVFDKPVPGNGAALDEKLSPPQPPGGAPATKPLAELTAAPIRFESLPTTVYPRAIFVDDVAGARADALLPGTWLGGIDVSDGIRDDMPLEKVTLEAGKGTTIKMSLTALRKLTVTVSRTAIPAGNAQGPLTVVALGAQKLDQAAKNFGFGEAACADVSGAKTASVEGVVVGKGPYWVTGILDDFGLGTDTPAGGLASINLAGMGLEVPNENRLSYAPDDYAVAISIRLNQVIPRQGGGADTVSCP